MNHSSARAAKTPSLKFSENREQNAAINYLERPREQLRVHLLPGWPRGPLFPTSCIFCIITSPPRTERISLFDFRQAFLFFVSSGVVVFNAKISPCRPKFVCRRCFPFLHFARGKVSMKTFATQEITEKQCLSVQMAGHLVVAVLIRDWVDFSNSGSKTLGVPVCTSSFGTVFLGLSVKPCVSTVARIDMRSVPSL